MTTASRKQVSQSAAHPGRLVTEASDLGLPPGVWPGSIVLVDEDNVGTQFTREGDERDGEGDLLYVVYRAGPITLRVFND